MVDGNPEVGDTYTNTGEFSVEEVRQFARISGDEQPRHTELDEDGRLLVHGLLTATLITKIGGDLEMLGNQFDLSFHRPVYTGDTITCQWTNETVDDRGEDRYYVVGAVECWNQRDEVVLEATVRGYVTTS